MQTQQITDAMLNIRMPGETTVYEVVISALKEHKKNNGETYHSFNALIQIPGASAGFLLGGFKISKGRLMVPTKFNPGTKKTFNILYVSRDVAEAIYQRLKRMDVDMVLKEDAVRGIVYDQKKLNLFLLPRSEE